jgi:hypothetical protein
MIAQAKAKPQQATLRISQGILLTVCGCFLIAAIFMSRYYGQWQLWHPNSLSESESKDAEFIQTQIGMLVLKGPAGQCRAYKYDNNTSETIPTSEPCVIAVQRDQDDSESGPSSRQLQALSKYFSQR